MTWDCDREEPAAFLRDIRISNSQASKLREQPQGTAGVQAHGKVFEVSLEKPRLRL